MSKKIKTTNIKQLISLENKNIIDSDIYFTINCNDINTPYDAVIVDGDMLSDMENITYQKVKGSMSGNIITDQSNKEYFLVAKSDSPCDLDINITFQKKTHQPQPSQFQSQPSQPSQFQPQPSQLQPSQFQPSQLQPSQLQHIENNGQVESSFFSKKYKILIIILITCLIIYLLYSIYRSWLRNKNKIPDFSLPMTNNMSPTLSSYSSRLSNSSRSSYNRSPDIPNDILKDINQLKFKNK